VRPRASTILTELARVSELYDVGDDRVIYGRTLEQASVRTAPDRDLAT